MSKLQAHMALAAISQQQQQQQNQHKLNKIKIAQQQQQQNNRPSYGSSSSHEFSPPSQIISNYANYETATRVPSWHHGYQSPGKNQGGNNGNREESQNQHLAFPSVHPSIITPFLEQIQIKQNEKAPHHAEQKQHTFQQQSHESSSSESNGSYEVINDVFSQHLVPPPASPSSSSKSSSKNHRHKGKQHEKPAKFNLSMQSPLQDASRFNYNNVISTATPSSTSTTHQPHDYSKYRPHQYQHESVSGADKLNIFVNLNRSKDNPYKQHKLLHPGYKKNPLPSSPHTFNQQEKPPHFLPTPFEASKEVEDIKIEKQPHHSFFTIEDAVTPHFPDSLKHDANQFSDEFEIITLRPQLRPTYASFTGSPSLFSSTTQITPSTTAAYDVLPSSSQKPKGKLRRRKPKPHLQQQQQQQSSQKVALKEVASEEFSTTFRPVTAPAGSRTRGSIKSNSTREPHTQENDLRTRNRINHPNRLRTRPNFSSPSATFSTAPSSDYDYTISPSIEAERKTEVSTAQTVIEAVPKTTEHFIEHLQQPDINIKHRVRLRYKNKLNLKSVLESGVDFKQQQPTKLTTGDNQISDSENENVVVKQPSGNGEEEESSPTEFTVVTENPFNEIKSSLKLPNLKLRNELLTTLASAESTISTSTTTSASSSEHDNNENNILHKIVNRPRFSIKELKRKQFLTSSVAPSSVSTTVLTSSTSTATPKADNQRFNRYRLNLNRRRNETSESNEEGSEVVVPRKRYSSSTRFLSSTSTTESPLTHSSTTKRTLPRRTYPVRNFTRPSASNSNNGDNIETTTSHKPSFISKNSTKRPSIRQRTQSHKRKEVEINAIDSEHEESIKNVNFPSETTLPHEAALTSISTTTSSTTEMPITRETSIMKIAKTPSSITSSSSSSPQPSNSIKATTTNSIEDTLASSTLSERHDLTDLMGSPSEHSQRITDLTVSANEDSSFKSANIGLLSRRIPNYFTISTDDPILPIQAFFPQIKTNESVSFTS